MLIPEFRDRIEYCCDPETLVEVLELTVAELISAFEERVEENLDAFDELFGITVGYNEDD